ncbi:hypothetical protein [Klebsiella quasipneumoniae]|nr:hypothetical protein [Klebsiella quasipneumoniae]
MKTLSAIYTTPSRSLTNKEYNIFGLNPKKGEHSKMICANMNWDDIVKNFSDSEKWQKIGGDTESTKSDLLMIIFGRTITSDIDQWCTRNNTNIVARSGFILDYDGEGNKSFSDIQKVISEYEYFLFSSPSYGIKPGDRCRIYLPFECEISADEWQVRKKSFVQYFNDIGITIDASCMVLSQGQNEPAYDVTASKPPYAYYNKGRFINPLVDIKHISPSQIPRLTTTYNPTNTSTSSLTALLQEVCNHNAGSLAYCDRRTLASLLVLLGVEYYEIERVLTHCSRPGFTQSNTDIIDGCGVFSNLYGLYKFVSKGFRIPEDILPNTTAIAIPQVGPVTLSTAYHWDYKKKLISEQTLSDITTEMPHNQLGKHLVVCGCAVGKTYESANNSDSLTIVPNTSIVSQYTAPEYIGTPDENTLGSNICTWNQLEKLVGKTHEQLSIILGDRRILDIDECHGLFCDYSYKRKTIDAIFKVLSAGYFRQVRFLSGTILPTDFYGISFDSVSFIERTSTMKKTINVIYSHNLSNKKTKYPEFNTTNCFDFIARNNTDAKKLILINDKKKCAAMSIALEKATGKKYLVVNADRKEETEIKALFSTGLLGEYDGVIGTASIFEGWNCNEVCEFGECHMIGDFSTARIQQFTHRWRKCSSVNVYHYRKKPEKSTTKILDELLGNIVDEANAQLSIANRRINGECPAYIAKYAIDNNSALIKYDKDLSPDAFVLNEVGISYNRFEEMARYEQLDSNTYYSNLMLHGFELGFEKTEMKPFGDFYKVLADIEKVHRELRTAKIDQTIQYWKNKTPVTEITDPWIKLLYGRMEQISNSKSGMVSADTVPEVLEAYKSNEKILEVVESDYDFNVDGSLVREYLNKILPSYLVLPGTKYDGLWLSRESRDRLATEGVNFVLKAIYGGSVAEMVGSPEWRGLIELDGNSWKFCPDHQVIGKLLGKWFGCIEHKQLCVAGKRGYYWQIHKMRSCLPVLGKRVGYDKARTEWFMRNAA